MLVYLATIFLSAFLLFQVQPIIARYILPWYGGTPAVWTTCMLCFQIGLLAGYTYAHGLVTLLRRAPKKQASVHLGIILLSLFWLPITPDDAMKPLADSDPTLSIVLLLMKCIGLPFIIISASGPLIQHWFATANEGSTPYRLYAVSNLGSLLGLIAYPFLIEPYLGLNMQTYFWSASYLAYGGLVLACARVFIRKEAQPLSKIDADAQHRPKLLDRLSWCLLAATGTMVLLATTNQICQDIAVAPFLWILPLGLYLISFIICFDHQRWYQRWLWIPITIVSIGLTVYLLLGYDDSHAFSTWSRLLIYVSAVFCGCMLCHGELVRIKPNPRHLTGFYLTISLGGALGGIFVGLIAPQIFPGIWELHIAIIAVVLLAGLSIIRDWIVSNTVTRFWLVYIIGGWIVLTGAMGTLFWSHLNEDLSDHKILQRRNFYGVLSVYEQIHPVSQLVYSRTLCHGSIIHGHEELRYDGKRMIPAGYFSSKSGIGLAFDTHIKRNTHPHPGLHIGVVGLGIGTLAGYADAEDRIRFYEINPLVEPIARDYFSYLEETPAALSIIDGDGRISLERELQADGSQKFDLLVLDAFSGDAIPLHLLTQEAIQLYLEHLDEGGLVAFQITNSYVDLSPQLHLLSETLNLQSILLERHPEYSDEDYSRWVIMSPSATAIERISKRSRAEAWPEKDSELRLWTDDYSNLLDVMVW